MGKGLNAGTTEYPFEGSWPSSYTIHKNRFQLDKRLDFKNPNNKHLAKINLKNYRYYLKDEEILTKTEI